MWIFIWKEAIVISAQLTFKIENQIITRTDSFKPASKSQNYLYAGFTFSPDWSAESQRVAIFSMGGKSYKMPLDENNECAVPWEVLANPGTVLVSVYSGNRITATSAKVQVIQSGYTDKITATQNPTIDVYASLMNRMDEIDQNIVDAVNDALTEAHDSGYFQGDPGVGIDRVVLNNDYTLTIYFTNGTVWASPTPIRGEKGEKGDTGSKGDKGDPGMTLSVNGTTLEIVTT